MAKAASWKRDGFHSVNVRLMCKDARKAVAFYEKAFGAKTRVISADPQSSRVMHAEIQIGDTVILLCDEMPEMGHLSHESAGQNGTSLNFASPDADADFQRAVDAGCEAKQAPADMFWGDRWGVVKDPFNNTWEICTHKEDLSPEEIMQRMQEAFSKMPAAAK